MARDPAEARRREAMLEARRIAVRCPGVRGVDFGTVYRDRVPIRESGIRFHVARKLDERDLPTSQVLPRKFGPVRCDVIQASYQPHGASTPGPLGVHQSVRPGVSIRGLARRTAGTIGAIVRDRSTGRSAILGNWHTLAGSRSCAVGDEVAQPGHTHLVSSPSRSVGALARWIELEHGLDAALALILDGIALVPEIFELNIAPAGTSVPVKGMQLVKFGTASRRTEAVVDGIDGSYLMDYGGYRDVERWMDGFRLVIDSAHPADEISLRGDSGALWIVEKTGAGVGRRRGRARPERRVRPRAPARRRPRSPRGRPSAGDLTRRARR